MSRYDSVIGKKLVTRGGHIETELLALPGAQPVNGRLAPLSWVVVKTYASSAWVIDVFDL